MIKHLFKGLIPSYTVILTAVQSYLKHSVPTQPTKIIGNLNQHYVCGLVRNEI